MGFSIWFDTINLGKFIVHIKASLVRIYRLSCISASEDCFYLTKQCRRGISSGSSLFAKEPNYKIPKKE